MLSSLNMITSKCDSSALTLYLKSISAFLISPVATKIELLAFSLRCILRNIWLILYADNFFFNEIAERYLYDIWLQNQRNGETR